MSESHPPAPEPPADRDAVTARLLVAGDPEGLRRLLQDHGGTVRARLRRDFGKMLDDSELDAAMGAMAVKVWHAAMRYDATKGSLRAWSAVIARNCALRLLEHRRRHATQTDPDLDRIAQPDPSLALPSAERERLLDDLRACIAELPPLQRAVAQADLEAGGSAEAERLARQFGTTANSIYVSRLKARRALRQAMVRRGHAVDRPAQRAPLPPLPHYEPRSEHG